jgi:quinoprotein relay system zinc metallohydrolase 1
MKRLFLLCFALVCLPLAAADYDYHLVPQRVGDGAYVFVGRNEDFTKANGGNIVNASFIVAPQGVIVIDTGPSRRYGEQMRAAIAAVSGGKPIVRVYDTHQHPDHFLGNQAFTDAPIAALPGTRADIAAEGNAFAENLYRLTGDWMAGTEVVVPSEDASAGRQQVGGRWLRLYALRGHTGADLAIYDEASGVLFAGDLVFNGRAPTTPHADVRAWLATLDRIEAMTHEPGFTAIVPGHGEVAHDAAPVRQTRDWLRWLIGSLDDAAARGMDMNEVLDLPLPQQFAAMAVGEAEYRRSVWHLYQAAEQRALEQGRVR